MGRGDLLKVEEETVYDAKDEAGPGTENGEGGKVSVLDVEHHILVAAVIVIAPAAGGGTVVGVEREVTGKEASFITGRCHLEEMNGVGQTKKVRTGASRVGCSQNSLFDR